MKQAADWDEAGAGEEKSRAITSNRRPVSTTAGEQGQGSDGVGCRRELVQVV